MNARKSCGNNQSWPEILIIWSKITLDNYLALILIKYQFVLENSAALFFINVSFIDIKLRTEGNILVICQLCQTELCQNIKA